MSKLTHIDANGQANMVDVTDKAVTTRRAVAEARVRMQAATLNAIQTDAIAKGEVLATARIAGIQAAKRCSELIPLCHPLALNKVTVQFDVEDEQTLKIEAECRVDGKTGVEMEALTAVSIAALTVYDMCKAIDRGMTVYDVQLVHKSGGKSGGYDR